MKYIKYIKNTTINLLKALIFKPTNYSDSKTAAFINSFITLFFFLGAMSSLTNIILGEHSYYNLFTNLIYVVVLVVHHHMVCTYREWRAMYKIYCDTLKGQIKDFKNIQLEFGNIINRAMEEELFVDPLEQAKALESLNQLKKELNLRTKDDIT